MDNLVFAARYRSYHFKVTYSFGEDLLNVEWGDIQGEPNFLFNLHQARRRLLRCLRESASVTKRAIMVTARFIRHRLGVPVSAIGPKCVLYQVTLREDDGKKFQEFVESKKLEELLQGAFNDVENYLKEILGEEYANLNQSVVEELKSVRVTSVEVCEDEIAEKVVDELANSSEPIGQPLLDVLSQVVGKLDGNKKQELQSKFEFLGITRTKHLRYLEEKEIASELFGILKPVEIRDLALFASGKGRPLPPDNLRVRISEYPNTALTVFFDDPNGISCDYTITAMDVVSKEEISVKSDANFGVLSKLRPGRKYVVYAQCANEDLKSKKTFFTEPINVFGPGRVETHDADFADRASEGRKKVRGTGDSGIYSEAPSSGLVSDVAEDARSVVPPMALGEEASSSQPGKPNVVNALAESKGTHSGTKRDVASDMGRKETLKGDTSLPSLWNGSIHREFTGVFPDMADSTMEDLLSKCEAFGLKNATDLEFLEKEDVTREFQGTLNIVEQKKLLKHVKERFERPEGISIGSRYREEPRLGLATNIVGFDSIAIVPPKRATDE